MKTHCSRNAPSLLLVSVLSADSVEITLTRQVLQKKGIIVLTRCRLGPVEMDYCAFEEQPEVCTVEVRTFWVKEAEWPVVTNKCRNLKNPKQKETPARQDTLPLQVNEGVCVC